MSVRPRTFKPARSGIHVTIGDDALVGKVLQGLTGELKRDAIESALFIATQPMQQAARAAAPRGTGPEKKKRRRKGGQMVEASYGRLFQNISRSRQKLANQPTVRIGVGKAFWGRFVEMGWNLTRRTKDGGTRVLRAVPAKPWFGPAIERSTPEMVAAFGTYLRVALIAAANRISSKVGAANATRIKPGRNE